MLGVAVTAFYSGRAMPSIELASIPIFDSLTT